MTVEYLLYESGYIACMLAVLMGALTLWLSRRKLPKTEPVIIALGAYTALPCLIALFSPSSAIVSPLRAFTAIGLAGAYVTARSLPRAWVERGLRYAGVVVAAIVMLESVITFGQRPTFLANPNMTASWLLLCWPWMPWWLAVGSIAATQSRAAIAGLVLAGLAVLLKRAPLSGRVRWAIVGGTALITPWAAYLRWNTVTDRMLTWVVGLRLFLARPLTGWGPGASMLFGRDHFDSAPLTISVEMGIVGLLAFVVLLVGLFRIASRSPSPARWALLALAVQNLADDTWLWPVTALLVGVTLSLLEDNNDHLRLVSDHMWVALRRIRLPIVLRPNAGPQAEGLVGQALGRDAAAGVAGHAGLSGGDAGGKGPTGPISD